ncbi:Short-chain dehydrogenase/reductase [Candidatus Protochlamydia naegleriophila]|uniref:Short-chain dehydrogenase/reductase n=1 Tax=Candidatus Protochlamydia naegleriophila TaxID=389348 RepID=A0A0U5EQI7_9BACT|nr:Short-chain dehydrogenase/reductase [Candidatus Protochlamydia naegleriophila]
MAWTLVTGGAKGLGADLCHTLAKEGYSIAVHYNRSEKEALEVVKHCQAFGVEAVAIQGDFSSLDSLLDFTGRYVKQFPDTRHLINNVGNYLIKSAVLTEVDEWMALFQTNLHTPFVLIKELLPSLTNLKGQIINIGICGLETHQARTYSTAYSMTKAGLLMLTRSLAKELAPQGVRVNMISPGHLSTSINLPEACKLPMGRPATCWEVSRVAAFLLHPDSAYLTGQNIEVAGGVGLS